jgi:CO dehydrogenase maturation factor
MAFTIAFCGKGGTGKSTLAALAVRLIAQQLQQSVLAVDADANTSLGELLGVEVCRTVSDISEDAVQQRLKVAPGMSKTRHIEYLVQQCVVEADGFDLLVMGRPEGPGCYCYVNHILRSFLEGLASSYPYVVMDNEAGMEHLSRLTTSQVSLLAVVVEPTILSVRAAGRILELASSLPVRIGRAGLVVNRVGASGIPEPVRARLEEVPAPVLGMVPYDQRLVRLSEEDRSLMLLEQQSPALQQFGQMCQQLLTRSGVPT